MLEYALKQERLKYNKLKYGASAAAPEGGGDGNAAAVAASGPGTTMAGDKTEMDEEITDMLPPLDTRQKFFSNSSTCNLQLQYFVYSYS